MYYAGFSIQILHGIMTTPKLPQPRTSDGRFTLKSHNKRKMRSLRLTDPTWEKIGEIAQSRCITRADLIEDLVETGVISQNFYPKISLTRSQILAEIEQVMNRILEDPNVTRKGKDKGAVRRTMEAFKNLFV